MILIRLLYLSVLLAYERMAWWLTWCWIGYRKPPRPPSSLPNGWTIAQIALAHGLDNGTVYRRWLRGWPVERLGEPKRKNGGNGGLGGSHDLAERRGTMLGRRTR